MKCELKIKYGEEACKGIELHKAEFPAENYSNEIIMPVSEQMYLHQAGNEIVRIP